MIYRKLVSRLSFCGKDVFLLGLILALGFITIWSYFNLDQRVFSLLCQRPVNWDGNFWLKAFSYLGKAWLLVWLLLVWFLSARRQRPVMVALLALIITTSMVTPLKFGVRRPRPYEVAKALSTGQEKRNFTSSLSFPSGDTASALAVATVITSFVPWPFACLFLAAGTGIALLRVAVMAHYPSDVFMGAALGLLAGWITIQIDRRWLPLEQPRFNLNRGVVISAIILIPIFYGLSAGFNKLLFSLETYGALAVFILLVPQVNKRIRKTTVMAKSADSERFYRALNWLRKRRTLVLKIAIPLMIAENIIDEDKPHELGFPDISNMAVIGLIFVLGGVSIRFWARGHFERGRLFTTGPYAMVRHPLYLGSLLVVVGALFQLNGWLNWVVILPLFIIFAGAAIIYEERSLEKKFDRQWQLYKAKAPVIIPSLRNVPLRRHLQNWQWKTYLSTSEPKTTLVLLSLPFLIELIEDFVFERMLGI